MIFLTVAFRLDFKTFVADVFTPAKADPYFKASFNASDRSEVKPMVIPEEVEEIAVSSQLTIHRSLANEVHLSGVVPDWQICEDIEAYCEAMFPDSRLRNEIRVFARATEPTWKGKLRDFAQVEGLDRIKNASIAINDDLIEMTGFVTASETKATLLDALHAQGSDDLPMVARLSVQAIDPEFDLWQGAEGALLVQGAMDAGSKTRLLTLIETHATDGMKVIDAMAVDAEINAPSWLPALENMLPDFLTNVSPDQLKVKGKEVVLKGATGSTGVAEAFSHYLTKAFPESAYQVSTELTIDEALPKGRIVHLDPDLIISEGTSVDSVLEESTIYFGSGRTGLGSNDRKRLRKLAILMKNDPDMTLEVQGHCDPSGDAELNKALAKRRCRSAMDYLVSQGVADQRLIMRAVGSAGKVGGSDSQQRRVEFRPYGEASIASAALETSQEAASMAPIALNGDEGARLKKVSDYAEMTKVYFATAKWAIANSHRRELDQLANYLNSFKKLSPKVKVRGLADPRGDAEYNLYLSRQRCQAVARYLRSKGVKDDFIEIEEKGATAVDLGDAAALRESRRVEFEVAHEIVTSA